MLTDGIASYNSPRMAGARLALAQYEPSTTWIPSKSDKPSRPSPLTPLEAATCYTCKDISFTKDVFTTSTGISNAASNVAAGTTNPPTPISYYMLYTSSIAESSKVSSNKHISFYMLYTPSPSANPSSLNIHNSSVTESLPLDYTPSTVCPLHNLTTTSWMTAPAITVTSVVTETWHRMVYSCNTTSVTTTATRDVTVNITLTVEKTVMPSLCSKVSSVQSMARFVSDSHNLALFRLTRQQHDLIC